jgi:hypothetical protein
MGVVHKLKNNVVEFIVHQKKGDPSLGCRQIAVITGKKFFFKVSKSSVNAVIKKVSLSSAVGRRQGWPAGEAGRPGKFHIPTSKKTQISEEMQRAGVKMAGTGTQPSPQYPSHGTHPVQPYPADSQVPQSQLPLDNLKDQVSQLHAEKTQDRGLLHEGMGFIFLKAAQWDLTGSSVWGKLFRKCTTTHLPLDFDALCDMRCYLSLLGIDDLGRTEQFCNHGIWILNTFDCKPTDFSSFDWTRMVPATPSLLAEYSIEREYLSEEISRFQICLKNGMILNVDPLMVTVWGVGGAGEFSAPVNKAMRMLSNCLISNNRPAIFLGLLGEQFSEEMSAMMAAMEGISGKTMTKITAVNHSNDPVAEFTTIPRKKRFFMASVWPWQREFSGFVQKAALGAAKSFYSKWLNREVFFEELNPLKLTLAADEASGEKVSLRTFTVFNEKGGAPQVGVLTNQTDGKSEDILEAFFLRWPHLNKGAGFVLRSGTAAECTESRRDKRGERGDAGLNCSDILGIYKDFGEMLNAYCQRYFFADKETDCGLTSMISRYYDIPGHCIVHDKNISIFLRPPPFYPFFEGLTNAVQRLNESAVTDPAGRNLLINIIKL